MEMETITIKVSPMFFSYGVTDAKKIETITLNFTPKIKEQIVAAYNCMKTYGFSCIEIPMTAILDDEFGKEVDWRESHECIKLQKGSKSITYYAENDYDCSDQIESEFIDFEKLGIHVD